TWNCAPEHKSRSISHLSVYGYCDYICLPSFPTRRSSDLDDLEAVGESRFTQDVIDLAAQRAGDQPQAESLRRVAPEFVRDAAQRSEEHTSELQSRGQLVCRLLLQKKKKT